MALEAPDYKKQVEALRYCVKARNCEKCAYRINNNSVKCRVQHVEDAATAIEELQQIADHYEQTAKDYWKQACEYKAQLPKHGEWIGIESDGDADGYPVYDVWECSECGDEHNGDDSTLPRYCPNCGAKMGVQDDNTGV